MYQRLGGGPVLLPSADLLFPISKQKQERIPQASSQDLVPNMGVPIFLG